MGFSLLADREDHNLELNTWSMHIVSMTMMALEMAYPSSLPKGMKAWAPEDPENRNEESRYWRESEQPGIPLHKLSSNDGWSVSREECEEAVAILRERDAVECAAAVHKVVDLDRALREETARERGYAPSPGEATAYAGAEQLWAAWVQFLTRAAAGVGFAVY